MPISSRLVVRSTIVLLVVGLLALIAIIGATVWLGERARVIFTNVIEAREARSAAVDLRDALRAAESSQRGYIVTSNEIYLAPYDAAKSEARKKLDIVSQKVGVDIARAPMIRRLGDAVADKMREMDETLALKLDDKNEDALALFRTNRGKALMDEINVFLTAIILDADERITQNVSEQSANATLLRLVSTIGGGVIILVVGGMVFMLARYAWEVVQARNEVRMLNVGLEEKVRRRTAELSTARERAELLLAEVNHRVANSLTLVASFARLQSSSASEKAAKDALAEIQARIVAISSVHRRLYTSGDVTSVKLEEYLSGMLASLEAAMHDVGHTAILKSKIEDMRLATNESVNLGVIVTEWVTNAFKYAYPDSTGEIRVELRRLNPDMVELSVEDDGVGRGSDPRPKGTGIGTRIVASMARTMKGDVEYQPLNPGTRARFVFPLKELPESIATESRAQKV